jgi:serine/threonine-protein kinase
MSTAEAEPMNVSNVTWHELSGLLDEALDLPSSLRAAWLEQQRLLRPDLASSLDRLLAAHATAETADVLARLPTLGPGAPLPAGSAGLAAGEQVGPYRLIREVGRGGMADVWLAERSDGTFERKVALKLPRITRLRNDLAVRFARERDILARLEHPNIARLYDAGVDASRLPYLAMEFVDGAPITRYCDALQLDVATRLRLLAQALDAVQFAHANLVIHRDLKPSNILVTADGQVRLLDFGIAKLLADDDLARESKLTQLSGRALTPDYASPEQIRGQPLTTGTDVYSLGVVLFELLTGGRPYRLTHDSPAQLEQAILAADPARPGARVDDAAAKKRGTTARGLARALAGDLDTIILKALAKEPARRYPTVGALAADLQRHLAGEAVRARPASFGYRAQKFIVRNRIAVGAAGAVVVALIAATAMSLWQMQLARAQAQRAEQVKRLVLSIFEEADTYSASGGSRQTTAVDLLEQARTHLTGTVINDPAIRVELLTSIGISLTGLGANREAAQVLEEAAALGRERLGADHLRTLTAQLHWGGARVLLGEFEPAAAQFDAAEAGLRRLGDRSGLAAALRWKSYLRALERRVDESVALAAEAVRVAETSPVPVDRRELLDAYLTLAGAMGTAHRVGRLAPARRAYELAREIYGERPTVPLLHAHSMYAYALTLEGDPSAGVAELQALLPQQIRLLGPDHVEVIVSYTRIGVAALTTGDSATAIDAYRAALAAELHKAGGAPSRGVGQRRYQLGNALLDARRDAEAETELREAVSLLSAQLPPESSDRQVSHAALALAMARRGRLAEAEAEATRAQARPLGATMDDAVIALRLGRVRLLQGRAAEALALLQPATEFAAHQALPLAHAKLRAALGAALLDAGNPAAARAELQTARALFESLQPRRSPDHADVLVDLARAQLALGEANAARALTEEAVSFWSRVDPGHRSAGATRLWQARSQLAAGHPAAAAAVLRPAGPEGAVSALPADRALLERTRREVDPQRLTQH